MISQLIPQLSCGLLLLLPLAVLAAPAAMRLEPDPDRAIVRFLGGDSEGGSRANTNLLRAGTGLSLRVRTVGAWRSGADLPVRREQKGNNTTRYRVSLGPEAELVWSLEQKGGSLSQTISGRGGQWSRVEALELVFPFDPQVTPTTVLPGTWNQDGSLLLPAIISAPDFGQWLLSCQDPPALKGRLEGSRAKHTVDFILELPVLREGQTCALSLTPVHLPPPRGLKDKSLWPAARRGWFGALQCSAQWGDPGNPFSAPPGMLANNVISDPASCSLWFYADQAF